MLCRQKIAKEFAILPAPLPYILIAVCSLALIATTAPRSFGIDATKDAAMVHYKTITIDGVDIFYREGWSIKCSHRIAAAWLPDFFVHVP